MRRSALVASRSEIDQKKEDLAWDSQFASSQDALVILADEALAEYRSGRTLPLHSDEE